MTANIYKRHGSVEKRGRNGYRDFDHPPRKRHSSYTSPSSSSSCSSSPEATFSKSRHRNICCSIMTLTQFSSATTSDDEYTSSDTDHLFMKESPRRQSSGTSSPPHTDSNNEHPIPPPTRSRTSSRSTPICICRNPSAIASAASSATAYNPVEPAIWNELRRLFQQKEPRKQFDILRRSTPVTDEQGNGFVLVEARVQAKDGTMVAKGEPCTDGVLSLRSLRNALMETKGAKNLPLEHGDEIIAGRIEGFQRVCSACSLPRF
jgi:hypothetical protein